MRQRWNQHLAGLAQSALVRSASELDTPVSIGVVEDLRKRED